MDYMKFIDSKDIRDFNKDTYFSMAEIAVIISHSNHTTIEEKIEAIKQLIAEHSREELDDVSRICNGGCIKLNPTIGFAGELRNYLEALEETLIYHASNWFKKPLFIASFMEIEYNNALHGAWNSEVYFDNYDAAYNYLVNYKKEEYLEDSSLKDVKTSACIKVYELSVPDMQYDSAMFFYNDAMELCQVQIPSFVCPFQFKDAFYVHVPSPFHVGDVVKWNSPFYKTCYGVIDHEPYSRQEDKALEFGDGTDIQEAIVQYYPPEIVCNINPDKMIERPCFWGWGHIPYLEIERCCADELPEDQKCLLDWNVDNVCSKEGLCNNSRKSPQAVPG